MSPPAEPSAPLPDRPGSDLPGSDLVTEPPDAAPGVATMRRIAGLALPALVVLAAEPLYVLVDTAVVGHLGRVPLAAVAVGGTVM